MTFKERKLNDISLNSGIPELNNQKNNILNKTGQKNTGTGIKDSLTHSTKGQKNLYVPKTGIPTKKHGILGSTILAENDWCSRHNQSNDNSKLKKIILEQLLESSKGLFLEVESVMAGMKSPKGINSGELSPGSKQGPKLISGFHQTTQAKVDDERQHLTRTNDDAREANSGMTARENIIGLTQNATNNNAYGKRLGAENHAQVIANKEQQGSQ